MSWIVSNRGFSQAAPSACLLLLGGFLLGLLFNLQDGGGTFLRNVSGLQRTTRRYILEDGTPYLRLCLRTTPRVCLIDLFFKPWDATFFAEHLEKAVNPLRSVKP
jgi:hypothetical protein